MMAIIGFSIGLLGYLLYTFIDTLAHMRYTAIRSALDLRDRSSATKGNHPKKHCDTIAPSNWRRV